MSLCQVTIQRHVHVYSQCFLLLCRYRYFLTYYMPCVEEVLPDQIITDLQWQLKCQLNNTESSGDYYIKYSLTYGSKLVSGFRWPLISKSLYWCLHFIAFTFLVRHSNEETRSITGVHTTLYNVAAFLSLDYVIQLKGHTSLAEFHLSHSTPHLSYVMRVRNALACVASV